MSSPRVDPPAAAGAVAAVEAVDVAVVGAGPAGMAAAIVAAEAGRRVVLVDEGPRPGGQIWRHMAGAQAPPAARPWLDRLARSGARLLPETAVVDCPAPGHLLAVRNGLAVQVRTDAILVATGARERFLPFPGWTLPGVVGVGGAQALLKSGLAVSGVRAVVAGTGPLLLPVAAALARSGAAVRTVAEQAPRDRVLAFAARLWRFPARLAAAGSYRRAFFRTPYRPGCWVVRADGDGRIQEVTLTDGRRDWREPCDLLCTGYGLAPSTELARLLGCALDGEAVRVDGDQRTSVAGVWCAGEPTGVAGVDAALAGGVIAGASAAGGAVPGRPRRVRDRERELARHMELAFALRPELRELADAETVVCRCEDVRSGQIRPEWDARQAKLLTRAGMGPCQGRICGAALRFLYGWDQDTSRPPLLPAPIGAWSSATHDPADPTDPADPAGPRP